MPQASHQQAQEIETLIGKEILGQKDLITEALCTFLAGGHLLMTGAPGLAKTTLVRVFSRYLGLSFGRIQFTPDLLPSDIIGSEILHLDPETGRRRFEFAQGPIFVSLLLADEINRASPRTQSAMLEAMQERQITAAGVAYLLPKPFMVFATQNPFESEGTFPLPEAQLDRFLLHSRVGYPDAAAEMEILKQHALGTLVGETTTPSEVRLDLEIVCKLQEATQAIAVSDAVLLGITELVRSSRPEDILCPEALRTQLIYGAGPRAGLSLISASRALAFLTGASLVLWTHVQRMAKPVLRHRLRLSPLALRNQMHADGVVDVLLHELEKRYSNLVKG